MGVSLPPEVETPEQITPVQQPAVAAIAPAVAPTTEKIVATKITKHDPFKSFLFDEEKFINQMENFHSKRRDELINSIEMPRLQINLLDPSAPPPVPYTTPKFTPVKQQEQQTTPPRFTPTPR